MRGGAEAARWAHNPKVAGSSPAPATKKTDLLRPVFLFIPSLFSLFQYAVDDAVIEVHMDFDSQNGDLAIAVGGAV